MQPRLHRLAECAVLGVGRNTEPDTHDDPARAQVVQRRDLLCELPRTAASNRRDHGAESYPAGPGRNGPEQHPRIVHRRPADGVELKVVPEKEAVPTGILSYHRKLYQLRRVAGIGHANTESHGDLLTHDHRQLHLRTI
jgi:hypothetical protein